MHDPLQKYPKHFSYKRNKIFALILIFVLFSQLLIDRNEEPYPAILLPGGGHTITNSKNFIYTLPEYRFRVHTITGDSEYIDKYDLFSTLPRSYVAVSYLSIPKIFDVANNDSDDHLATEAQLWLKNRLALNNFNNISHLEFKGYLKSIVVNNGRIDSVKEELIFDSLNIDLKDGLVK